LNRINARKSCNILDEIKNQYLLVQAQIMTTTWDMEEKRSWNFFAFGSVADAFDSITKEYGAKQDWGTIACFLVLQLDDDQRRKLKRILGLAEVESRDGGDLLQEMRKMLKEPLVIKPPLEGAKTPTPKELGANVAAAAAHLNQLADKAEKAHRKKRPGG
jgi:hypothetical protein